MTVAPEPSRLWSAGLGYGDPLNLDGLGEQVERQCLTMLDGALDTVPGRFRSPDLNAEPRAAAHRCSPLNHRPGVMCTGRVERRSLLIGSVSHLVLQASTTPARVVHGAVNVDRSVPCARPTGPRSRLRRVERAVATRRRLAAKDGSASERTLHARANGLTFEPGRHRRVSPLSCRRHPMTHIRFSTSRRTSPA